MDTIEITFANLKSFVSYIKMINDLHVALSMLNINIPLYISLLLEYPSMGGGRLGTLKAIPILKKWKAQDSSENQL